MQKPEMYRSEMLKTLKNVFLNRPIGKNIGNDLPADANKTVLRFGKAPFLPMI